MKQSAITQEDPMGCGVACVAFILNKTYKETIKLFPNPHDSKTKGFYCKEIIEALKRSNLSYAYKYIKNSKLKRLIYNDNSIVYLRRSKKYPAGHYLCRYKNLWMDSWTNFPNEDRKAGFRKKLPGRPIYVIFLAKII